MTGAGMEEISRNEIKKKRFFIAVIVAVLLVGCVAIISNFNDKSGKELYPMPEKMVVYYNGEATELTQQDEAFSKLYMLNTLPKKKDIMETAIDPDGVAECKEVVLVFFKSACIHHKVVHFFDFIIETIYIINNYLVSIKFTLNTVCNHIKFSKSAISSRKNNC